MNRSRISRTIVFSCFLLSSPSSLLSQGDVKPSVSPAIKTFSMASDIAGAAASSVNLFTGDISLPLNLVSLPGHNGLNASVSIGYSSNIQGVADNWNLESPPGVLGLGWSINTPKIISDNKQTGTREDDDFFLLEGGSSTQLIRTNSGTDADGSYYLYETKNYQFWKIKFYYDLIDWGYPPGYGTGPNKWVIIKEDGTKYIYGDKNSNRSTIQWAVRWENWIGNSAQITGQSQFASIWNLSEIINLWNERITFSYDNVDQFVGSSSGQKHTEASYLKMITDVWGRKISFIYKDKQTPYYIEPHSEQAEPDAYQEVYEKKYLDAIEVLSESNSKVLSIQFTYTIINSGTNAVKMLLSSVVQKNSGGNSFPGLRFSYYQSGLTKGMLSTVTYPAGGTVSYTYTEKTIAHSNRELLLNAPAGFAEPRVWMAEDYAVVTWRQLGTTGGHDSGPREIKLYVYQWVGEWKEQFLQTISGVSLTGPSTDWNCDYKDFQVTLQKDFFAVLSKTGLANSYSLFIRYKDPNARGGWLANNTGADFGTGTPTLMSGNNFLAVGSFQDDATHPCYLYTYQGNSFKLDQLNQPIGDHYYTAANNYFISHNRAGVDGLPEINFNYLTADKKWVTKPWSSFLEFSSVSPSFWYGGNSMAVCMANNNPEYAYRWDMTYTNFFRDSKDKNNTDLFGSLYDGSYVSLTGNSLVGIYGRLARFDGLQWSTVSITSSNNGPNFSGYFAYGDDYVVRPTEFISSTSNYRGGLKVFNPNTLTWESDIIMDGTDRGKDYANAGIDYYYFGNGYYYRQPNGTWIKKITYPASASIGNFSMGGWPRFDVLFQALPFAVSEMRLFKNGEISAPLIFTNRRLYYGLYKFKTEPILGQTVVSYPAAYTNREDATSIYLNRVINDAASDYQKDYPVTLITVNDGLNNQYTTFDYNTTTASFDAGGSGAQYNEVTLIPGSNVATSKPYGYTKTFFQNGLTSTELASPTYVVTDLLWLGAPYSKEVYDKNGVLKGYDRTTYQTYTRDILNDQATKVNTGNYIRSVQINSMVDNIETITNNSYDQNTGLVTETTMNDYNSRGGVIRTSFRYFWQEYDINRTLNILSPVIQEKKTVINGTVQTVVESSATTWKSWNSILAAHKTYNWKKTGSPDFNFSTWSNTGEPISDWLKLSEVNSLNSNGSLIQQTEN